MQILQNYIKLLFFLYVYLNQKHGLVILLKKNANQVVCK